jgi:hypothetical protein
MPPHNVSIGAKLRDSDCPNLVGLDEQKLMLNVQRQPWHNDGTVGAVTEGNPRQQLLGFRA